MEIKVTTLDHGAILAPQGPLSAATMGYLHATADGALLGGTRRLILSLAGVTSVSHRAAMSLTVLNKAVRAFDGALLLCDVDHKTGLLLREMGLSDALTQTSSIEEATLWLGLSARQDVNEGQGGQGIEGHVGGSMHDGSMHDGSMHDGSMHDDQTESGVVDIGLLTPTPAIAEWLTPLDLGQDRAS